MSNSPIKLRLREYLRAKGIKPNNSDFILCPFHQEKTASCRVYEDHVYCYGCHNGGDVFAVAAALNSIPYNRENFREVANEVEQVLGLPLWQPPKRTMRSPPGLRLSKSAVFRSELLKEFAKAIDSDDMGQAYHKAYLLFALFMLPEDEFEQSEKKKKPSLQERMAGYGIKGETA